MAGASLGFLTVLEPSATDVSALRFLLIVLSETFGVSIASPDGFGLTWRFGGFGVLSTVAVSCQPRATPVEASAAM